MVDKHVALIITWVMMLPCQVAKVDFSLCSSGIILLLFMVRDCRYHLLMLPIFCFLLWFQYLCMNLAMLQLLPGEVAFSCSQTMLVYSTYMIMNSKSEKQDLNTINGCYDYWRAVRAYKWSTLLFFLPFYFLELLLLSIRTCCSPYLALLFFVCIALAFGIMLQ